MGSSKRAGWGTADQGLEPGSTASASKGSQAARGQAKGKRDVVPYFAGLWQCTRGGLFVRCACTSDGRAWREGERQRVRWWLSWLWPLALEGMVWWGTRAQPGTLHAAGAIESERHALTTRARVNSLGSNGECGSDGDGHSDSDSDSDGNGESEWRAATIAALSKQAGRQAECCGARAVII